MLQRLKIELEAKERSRTLEPKLYPPYEKYSTTSSLTVSSNTDNRRCGYCSGLHPPAKCQKISEPNARKNCHHKKGNCFICLKYGHTSISCPSNYKCFKCGGKHHISIGLKERHFVRPLDNEGRKTEYVDNTHVNTHLSTEKNNGSNGVLLQTAQAELSNFDGSVRTNGRLLFDSGSQRTYIKEEMRNKLQLNVLRKETCFL